MFYNYHTNIIAIIFFYADIIQKALQIQISLLIKWLQLFAGEYNF